MQRAPLLLPLCLLTLSACRAGRVEHAGDVQGEARIEALPSLDVDEGQLTREMRYALTLSKDSLALRLPDFEHDPEAMARWTDQVLKQWLRDKQSGAEAASSALDVAAGQNGRQRIVSGALAGLVFEQTARLLLEVPPPSDLPLELEVVAVFREIMQKNASVCVEHARLAYAACAENAQGMKSLGHFGPFCAERGKALPDVKDPLGEP